MMKKKNLKRIGKKIGKAVGKGLKIAGRETLETTKYLGRETVKQYRKEPVRIVRGKKRVGLTVPFIRYEIGVKVPKKKSRIW